jgi:5-oxoprolinase (ATP-hydrolysing)
MTKKNSWSFWIDRGGTFTDVVAQSPSGEVVVKKLLSENPEQYHDAPLHAIRECLNLKAGEPIPASAVTTIKMGTTVATNALLERQGAPVCFLVTKGFADVLKIAYQDRPEIFALEIKKPESLVSRVIEVDERINARGETLRSLDLNALKAPIQAAIADGYRSFAIVLLHAYAHPKHELAIGDYLDEVKAPFVSLSHQLAPEIKMVSRGDTTTVDAYLTPILRSYIARFRKDISADIPLRFMQSHGGLADADQFTGKDAILSGPAGGVVAYAAIAKQAGFHRVIGFDMGGTSTDVSRYAGEFERVFEAFTAGVRIQAPMLNIVTVAAGGGSLLTYQDGRFKVGPESAGAKPGPVCYRRGGPLTVTDANAVLGRIQEDFFPRCFGPGADEALDIAASRKAFKELIRPLENSTGEPWTVEQIAAGFLRIANENMVKPIREISVARGYDVRDDALMCFGGAGAQHACALAQELGIPSILIHPLSGVLSAYGMGLADFIHSESRAVMQVLEGDDLSEFESGFQSLEHRGRKKMLGQGIVAANCLHRRSMDLRYCGVDDCLNVELKDGLSLAKSFEVLHTQLFGFHKTDHPMEVVNLRLETRGLTDKIIEESEPLNDCLFTREDAHSQRTVYFDAIEAGRRQIKAYETPVFERKTLRPGTRLTGPALIVEDVSTTVVDPGWTLRVDARKLLILEAPEASIDQEITTTKRDPVLLEVFNNLFMSIAEQMGITLRKVSHSTNIKERLDFSCALFDGDGHLIANAPHIPVHLGAMGESVRAVIEGRNDSMKAGDVYITNDPYNGGSHLPDITIVTPVFDEAGEERLFFVANRGHHSDIGGKTPGSMPAFSRTINEEGVLLSNLLLVSQGHFLEDEIRAVLGAGEYPARGMSERISDLRAQIAANNAGVRLLKELSERVGLKLVQAYMTHVRENAEEAMRAVLSELPDGESSFFDYLDEGARIEITITIEGSSATLDFSGTDATLSGNLNAPSAVVRAAVLYAFRTLIPRPIPLNAGCLEPLTLIIPEDSLLNPKFPAAVVGGNVETSMRITDVVYGALKKLAAGQGTMNNLTFGNENYGYYETICGGAGAGLGFDGASAVHTHMTNTRITDPEVLERRYPVLLERFAIRPGSGGQGIWAGGHGVIRELRFLEAMTVSILSERRGVAPYGLHGGGSGKRGRNVLVRENNTHELPGKTRIDVLKGDLLRIETPGGGAYNPSAAEWQTMSPAMARQVFREGRYDGPTSGIASGYLQANLVILDAAVADDFEGYCQANFKPCPLLERLEPGSYESKLAAGSDLRFDLPKYRRFINGENGVEWSESTDIEAHWTDNSVAFLLGCSFSFEQALSRSGLVPRHIEEGKNVPMYRTSRRTETVGPFSGPLVVSMRPIRQERVDEVFFITAPFRAAHGDPIYVGQLSRIGIESLDAPDFGDAVTVKKGEVAVFWACGVTSQVAVQNAIAAGAIESAITHAPGHMIICDLKISTDIPIMT